MGIVQGADFCRPTPVEEREVRGREVGNRACRVRDNHVDGEEAFLYDGVGGAERRKRLLRNGWISQGQGLRGCYGGRKNDRACKKGRAMRVGSIHHCLARPGRLVASITGTAPPWLQRLALLKASRARNPPSSRDGFCRLPVSSQQTGHWHPRSDLEAVTRSASEPSCHTRGRP